MTLPMTALLGIVGALVGGFLYSLIRGASVHRFRYRPQLVRVDRRHPGCHAPGVDVSRHLSQKVVELTFRSGKCNEFSMHTEQLKAESQLELHRHGVHGANS